VSESILQVIIAVFSGSVEVFFGQRWLSPLEKMARTPMLVRTARISWLHDTTQYWYFFAGVTSWSST